MANTNSTSPSGYQHYGKSIPISSLTSDPQILKLASTLHQQAIQMDQAHIAGTPFEYHPIKIPPKFQRIFGS